MPLVGALQTPRQGRTIVRRPGTQVGHYPGAHKGRPYEGPFFVFRFSFMHHPRVAAHQKFVFGQIRASFWDFRHPGSPIRASFWDFRHPEAQSEPHFGISDTRKLRGDPRIGPKTHKRLNKKRLNKKRMVPTGAAFTPSCIVRAGSGGRHCSSGCCDAGAGASSPSSECRCKKGRT